jgi:transmembrane sensor
MNDVKQEHERAAHARNIEARAAAWLEQKTCGDWQKEDQCLLDHWLAESPTHEVAFLRLSSAWGQADRLAVLRDSSRKPASQDQGGWSFSAKAATFVMLVAAIPALFGGLYLYSPSKEKIYATGLGGRQTIAFADGSQVELNTDTVIRTKIDSGQRKLWLEKGEAYFQINHDIRRPFVVAIGDLRVTDLGTKFLIRRDGDRLEIALLEGRIRFDAPRVNANPMYVDLSAGDHLIARNGSVAVTKQSLRAQENDLAWRHGLLVFDRTTLADAAAQFNRYNRKKILIEDMPVARMTIGGTFRADNLDRFVGVTQDVLGLHTSVRDGTIVISR